jgi:hypothetical protein
MAQHLESGRIGTAGWIVTLTLLLYGALLGGLAALVGLDGVMCFQFMYFRGAVGIPSAIIASMGVIALFAASVGGEFKLKVWGLSFEGPSAPITMWVVCFLAISLSLYMLLPEVKSVEALPPALAKFCAVD